MYDRRPGFFREDMPPAPGRRVDAKVKWFNASKGFGFVTMSDGTQDAFLPMAILRRAGYEDVREGASITCEISAGAKGPLVTNVLNIDNSTAVAPRAAADGFDRRPPASLADAGRRGQMVRPEKGYGFISPDGGGKDVFIHITALRRSGSMRSARPAGPGRGVEGKKGLEADRITAHLTRDRRLAASPRRRAAGSSGATGCRCNAAPLIPAMRMHAPPTGLQT